MIIGKTKKGYILLLLLLGSFSLTYSQTEESKHILTLFDSRFVELDSLIFNPQRGLWDTEGTSPKPDEVAQSIDRELLDSIVNKRVQAEVSLLKAETGLQLTGQTYYRLDEGYGLDEDDALSRYKGKIQAEARWYFLQSSLYKRKGRINELQLKGQIDRLAYEKENLGILIGKQKMAFRLKYDSLLCSVLLHRIQNLSLLSNAQSYLLLNEHISSDELLTILNEKAEAERLLATIDGIYAPSSDLSTPKGVVIQIDTLSLIDYIRQTHTDLSTVQLRMDLLKQQQKNTNYWSSFNIAPFVRYSYYTRPHISNSSNVDAGIVFSLPISSETKRKKGVLRAEQDLLSIEKDRLSERILDDVHLTLLEVERLNRASIGEYNRLVELKSYLTMRSDAYNNRIGEYSRLARIKEYNSYLLCWEKLVMFQYQRDCLVANLQAYLTDIPILKFCHEQSLSTINK